MATLTHDSPVNPAQVIAATSAEGCVVRADPDAGTWEVDVPGVDAETIASALAVIVYDENIGSVPEALNAG